VKGRLVPYPKWLKITSRGLGLRSWLLCYLLFLISSLGASGEAAEARSVTVEPDHYVDPSSTTTGETDVQDNPPYTPLSLYLEARDGYLLHVTRYRPSGEITGAVILIHDWSMAGLSCWGLLPDSLAEAGFDVLIPDLRQHGLSGASSISAPLGLHPTKSEMAVLASDALIWLDLIDDSVELISVMCVGRLGELAELLAQRDSRVKDLVWISPAREAGDPLWSIPHSDQVRFLFVSSGEDPGSAALAGDLFINFNATAELRLFNRGVGGCPLIQSERFRGGLVSWITLARCGLEKRTGRVE